MTLTEQIADAERQAREAVLTAAEAHSGRRYALAKGYRKDAVAMGKLGAAEITAALDRYGEVCRLAGRWEEHSTSCQSCGWADDCATEHNCGCAGIRIELARLMAEAT